jgi:two-component system alkaline phosphatase synthesis response regulator PhoP
MATTILVVDDERDILELLQYNLEKEGYRVLTAHNGREGLRLAARHPNLVILDVMMPEMDGWEVCKSLRANPTLANTPVIFLTARDHEVDEVLGLELGADDYITKPVKVRTLIARVKRALRPREEPLATKKPEVLRVGELEIHTSNYFVRIRNREIPLPRKEFEVLLFLVRHPDRVISRETILNEVWGRDVYVVDRTIDVHIRKIREKLGVFASHIDTVKGVGYRFKKDLS